MRGLMMLHRPKPATERDELIIEQSSHIVVAVGPVEEQTVAILNRAKVAGRRIIYLGIAPQHPATPVSGTVSRRQGSPTPSATGKNAGHLDALSRQSQSAARPVPEVKFTAGKAITTPGPQGTSVHVGVITSGSPIKKAQAAALARELRKIPVPEGGKLVLHHGCDPEADTAAHEAVRTVKGWEIHGHPVSDSKRQPPAELRGLHTVHTAKPRNKRDIDIVTACRIIIFVEPRPPGAKALRKAAAADVKVISVPTRASKKKALSSPAPSKTIRRPAAAQVNLRTRKLRSYALYDEQEERIAALLHKLNQPESLVDTWR